MFSCHWVAFECGTIQASIFCKAPLAGRSFADKKQIKDFARCRASHSGVGAPVPDAFAATWKSAEACRSKSRVFKCKHAVDDPDLWGNCLMISQEGEETGKSIGD
jgi:hypothetical protein